MMKATPKFDKELEEWVVDIETEEGEIIPVGKTIVDKNIEKGMKVYFDGDSEWYASPWGVRKD